MFRGRKRRLPSSFDPEPYRDRHEEVPENHQHHDEEEEHQNLHDGAVLYVPEPHGEDFLYRYRDVNVADVVMDPDGDPQPNIDLSGTSEDEDVLPAEERPHDIIVEVQAGIHRDADIVDMHGQDGEDVILPRQVPLPRYHNTQPTYPDNEEDEEEEEIYEYEAVERDTEEEDILQYLFPFPVSEDEEEGGEIIEQELREGEVIHRLQEEAANGEGGEEDGRLPDNIEIPEDEMDYQTLLETLKRKWMDTELEHTVSKVASNLFWSVAFKYIPKLLHVRELQRVKRKIPQFNQVRRTLHNKHTPAVDLEIGYKSKDSEEVIVVEDTACPKSRFPPDQFDKLYEIATVKVNNKKIGSNNSNNLHGKPTKYFGKFFIVFLSNL